MEKLIDKVYLRNIFSKSASGYDSEAWLQKKLSLQLINNIKTSDICPKLILDIGMGTGFLMQELSRQYPAASVLGVDFAFGMNKLAKEKNLNVFQADAEMLPFKDDSFDLVVSNLVYQWVFDLGCAILEVRRVLKDRGDFYFNFFGRDTLKELRFSFSEANNNCLENLFSKHFKPPNAQEAESALEKNHFKEIKINTTNVKMHFKDLFSLVRWLKLIGANRIAKPIFIGKEIWQDANKIYSDNFRDRGLVFATFEVIEVKAKK